VIRARWLVLVGLAACGRDGRVELALGLPVEAALDPMAGVEAMTLTARVGGEVSQSATIEYPGPLAFGETPIGEGVEFELAATSASGRVIGFGRAAPVDVTLDDVVTVPLAMRRPFAYLAGGARLLAIDETLEATVYAGSLEIGSPQAVAALPSGTGVLVAHGAELDRLSTSDHRPVVGHSIELAGVVLDLAVSPDGRWAVATHTDPAGVSIVDLEAETAQFVATATPGRVAISNTTAWVIQDPLDNIFCAGASTLLPVALAGAMAGAPVDLGGVAASLALDPDSDTVVVVRPCGDAAVVAIDGAGGEPRALFTVAGGSAVTVDRGRVWVTGHVDGEDAHLIVASAPLAGGDVREVALETTEERAVAPSLTDPTQSVAIEMTADLSSAFDLAILPGGTHAAILMAAVYFTDPVGDDGTGRPIVPGLQMITYEYQLVELDTGVAGRRLRTSCNLSWDPGALIDDLECALAPGQDEAPVELVPTDLTVLYGSR
jgi:DNA-binding beta-propeller fold protein YncE